MLASWLSEKHDVAESLANFEETFSGARGKKSSTRRRSAQEFEQQVRRVHRASLSSDEGLGTSVGSPTDKNLSQKFERALDLLSDKDSGYVSAGVKELGLTPEDDDLAKDLIQGWLVRCLMMCSVNIDLLFTDTDSLPAPPQKSRLRTAVTQSVAPPTKRRHPPLSNLARKKISQNILGPILREERFEDFHPLVISLGSKTNKAVRCLRDLEQSLIFQPLVSNLLDKPISSPSDADKTLSISSQLYRAFGEFSIQLVVDTYHQLSELDQRRAADRPYDNGYFLDLVQQVGRLAAQVGRKRQEPADNIEEEEAYSPEDEVTLEGGLGSTGEVAELVRWKNGKGISLRTGMPYEPTPGIKREASSMLDDDAARSMARRKKGYIPEIVEMKCSDRTCGKIFTRKCDLAKHEKTHSRPFKCPEETCKYHELGLPTEKERDRHINDKHDPNPKFYKCMFCEFRTKRESNCKQHMEKAHGWQYVRSKNNGKGRASVTRLPKGSVPQSPASMLTPLTPIAPSPSWATGSASGSSRHDSMPPPVAGPSNFGTPNFTHPSPDFVDHFNMNFDFNNMASVWPMTPAMSDDHRRHSLDTTSSSNSGLQLDGAAFDDGVSPDDLYGFNFNDFNFPQQQQVTPDSSAAGPSHNGSLHQTSPGAQLDQTFTYDAMNVDEAQYGHGDFTLFGDAPPATTGDMFPSLATWGSFNGNFDSNNHASLQTGNSTLDDLFPELRGH